MRTHVMPVQGWDSWNAFGSCNCKVFLLNNAAILRCFYYHLNTEIIFVTPDCIAQTSVELRQKLCEARWRSLHLMSLSTPISAAHIHHDRNFSSVATFTHLAFGIKFYLKYINHYNWSWTIVTSLTNSNNSSGAARTLSDDAAFATTFAVSIVSFLWP